MQVNGAFGPPNPRLPTLHADSMPKALQRRSPTFVQRLGYGLVVSGEEVPVDVECDLDGGVTGSNLHLLDVSSCRR